MEVYAYEPLGYEGCLVRIEVDIRRGIPAIDIVGLAAAAVRESRERVRAAIRNSGYEFPQDRILINLSPADLPKEGASYDLPIAVRILSAAGAIPECGNDILVMGELTLDGKIHAVRAVLPAYIQAAKLGIRHFVVPRESAAELGEFWQPDHGKVYAIDCINDLAAIMLAVRNGKEAENPDALSVSDPPKGGLVQVGGLAQVGTGSSRNSYCQKGKQAFNTRKPDFSDYHGDKALMRALVIAAAGRHNILLFGPPGSGKTAAALRFPSLLPPLTENEALEVGVIWSLYGKSPSEPIQGKDKGWVVNSPDSLNVPGSEARTRAEVDCCESVSETQFGVTGESVFLRSGWQYPPVRAPHHSASCEGMIGGGHPIKPGEISLAHRGLLFLDETTEFRRDVLQSLREPMEKGYVTIVRAGRTVQYPASFQLIMAANPCPCGNLGSPVKTCVCSPQEIQRYWKKLGGPLLDRIDMRVPVGAPTPEALLSSESGQQRRMLESVLQAVRVQELRMAAGVPQGTPFVRNGDFSPDQVSAFCNLTKDARLLLAEKAQQLGLSARACHSILKLGRTIGDLDGKEVLDASVIEEAIGYRQFGDGDLYWPF